MANVHAGDFRLVIYVRSVACSIRQDRLVPLPGAICIIINKFDYCGIFCVIFIYLCIYKVHVGETRAIWENKRSAVRRTNSLRIGVTVCCVSARHTKTQQGIVLFFVDVIIF